MNFDIKSVGHFHLSQFVDEVTVNRREFLQAGAVAVERELHGVIARLHWDAVLRTHGALISSSFRMQDPDVDMAKDTVTVLCDYVVGPGWKDR